MLNREEDEVEADTASSGADVEEPQNSVQVDISKQQEHSLHGEAYQLCDK